MHSRFKIAILLLSLFTHSNLKAQIASIFENFKFGDPISVVQKELGKISDSTRLIEISNPSFPLAKNTEAHLLAHGIKVEGGKLTKAVFTFSDDHLSYIELRGNVSKSIQANRENTSQKFMDYNVFAMDLLFIHSKEDAAWILTPESTHPNLFTWSNPLLLDVNNRVKYNPSAKIPEFVQMGGALESQLEKFKKASKLVQVDELNGSDPNAQVQINAFGIEYAGFPRKFEARFGDDKLNMIWVLTAKGEEDRIRRKLTETFGQSIFSDANWEFFNDWTVGLRKDKPEVLFLTKQLGLQYKKRLSNK